MTIRIGDRLTLPEAERIATALRNGLQDALNFARDNNWDHDIRRELATAVIGAEDTLTGLINAQTVLLDTERRKKALTSFATVASTLAYAAHHVHDDVLTAKAAFQSDGVPIDVLTHMDRAVEKLTEAAMHITMAVNEANALAKREE